MLVKKRHDFGAAGVDVNGKWANPALVDIFKVKDERERFLGELLVNAFIAEQSKLDKYLFDVFKSQRPDLLKLKYLQTQGGKAITPPKETCARRAT